MSEALQEILPEDRLAEMQKLLAGIVESGWSDLESITTFMGHYNLYETPTDADFIELCKKLDMPGKVQWSEATFDYLVSRFDRLGGDWSLVETKTTDNGNSAAFNWVPAEGLVPNFDGSTALHRYISQAVVFRPPPDIM